MSTKDPNMKVIIGADTKDFDKGAKSVKQGLLGLGKDANEFGGAMKALSSKGVAAFAAVAAAVAGAIKVVKDLSQQNQALGDAWERTCSQMTGAFDSFKTSVANLNFSNLFSNMKEAGRLAGELYNAQDGLGEVQTSYNMSLARQQKTINQLRLDMSDLSKTDAERIEAGQKLLKIYEDLEKNPTRALSSISDASLDVISNKLGYSLGDLTEEQLNGVRRQTEQFFIWLGTEVGESWNSAFADAFADPSKLLKTTMAAQNAGLSEAYRKMLWNYQGAVGDKDRLAMEEAVVAYYDQEAKLSAETFRIRKQIQSIQNASANADASAAEEAARKAAAELKRQQQAKKEIDEMLVALDKRLANNERLSVFDNLPKVNDIGAFTAMGGLATITDEFKQRLTAELGDITVYVGIEADTQKVFEVTNEINSIIESSVIRSSELIGNLLGTLSGGGDAWGDFKNAALSAFGDLAIAVGKIAISAGMASEGIKAALHLDNPYIAIAAGAALIALGTAVKSSLSAVASGDYSAGGGGYSGGYSSSSGSGYDTREVYVNVSGTLQADGNQLIAVINNTNKKNYYTQ